MKPNTILSTLFFVLGMLAATACFRVTLPQHDFSCRVTVADGREYAISADEGDPISLPYGPGETEVRCIIEDAYLLCRGKHNGEDFGRSLPLDLGQPTPYEAAPGEGPGKDPASGKAQCWSN